MITRKLIVAILVVGLAVGATAILASTQLGGDSSDQAGGEGSQQGGGPQVGRASGDPTDITEADLTQVLPPDSIPAIDDPKFVSIGEADFVTGQEPVAAIEVNGDARAYPLQIMTWHEIVNDEIGGQPITVTYCPLCNTALAYDRVVNGTVLDFGTSGALFNSALVMFDRQTDSKWLHFEGLAVIGELEGTKLDFIPMQIISFEQFRDQYPDGKVLSNDTGFDRPYGTNPYEFYDTNENPFLFEGEVDPRLDAMQRVAGVEIDGETAAFPYNVLRSDQGAGAVNDTVGGTDIAVFWKAGVNSALDDPDIANARDVGSAGVFMAEAEGQKLTFEAKGDQIVDKETGSTWKLTGQATSGPLEGTQLEKVNFADTFWFAWAAHNADTKIFGE